MTTNGILLILGACAQLPFAGLQTMLVIFSAASIVDRRDPEPLVANLLGASVFVLPGLCLLTAGVLIYKAIRRPTPLSHLWHLLSVLPFVAYIAIAARIMG